MHVIVRGLGLDDDGLFFCGWKPLMYIFPLVAIVLFKFIQKEQKTHLNSYPKNP